MHSILLPFPQFRQSTEWCCGATALQMVLAYYGMDVREERLRALAGTTPKWGTSVIGMQRALRKSGLRMIARQMTVDEVQRFIQKKIPVILLLQAWTKKKNVNWADDWNDGHYAVAIGFDSRRMIFADPASVHRSALTYAQLEQRWHDSIQNKKIYEHYGIAVVGKKSYYRQDAIVSMD